MICPALREEPDEVNRKLIFFLLKEMRCVAAG